MKKIVIVRVCEIFLKGKNRSYFLSLLENHIKKSLENINYKLVKIQMRYLIEDFAEEDYDKIISALLKISGIHTVSPAYCVKSDIDEIRKCFE